MTADIDLAGRWLGASVLAASDESFGEKEHLLYPAAPAFVPGTFGPRGEVVDGWETKRRREPGHDWALIRLGAPGVITAVDVDTSFFTGNHPESCLVEACGAEGYPSPAELTGPDTEWTPIVPHSPLRGDGHNEFAVTDPHRYTHLRLSVFPDGGVARLRVRGHPVPDPRELDGLTIDLASQRHGGLVVASSDEFYTSASALNRPGQAQTMGEGWETRRRRDGGHDFAVLRLAFAGQIRQLIVDTAHFKYNASAQIEAWVSTDGPLVSAHKSAWQPLLRRTRLQPDTRHVLPVAGPPGSVGLRLDAFPDGGISRVRVIGAIDAAARVTAGLRWLNSLPDGQAAECLENAGLTAGAAAAITAARPLPERGPDGWPGVDAADGAALAALVDGPGAG